MTKQESSELLEKVVDLTESDNMETKFMENGLSDIFVDNQKRFSFMIVVDSDGVYYLLFLAYDLSVENASITSNYNESYVLLQRLLTYSGDSGASKILKLFACRVKKLNLVKTPAFWLGFFFCWKNIYYYL